MKIIRNLPCVISIELKHYDLWKQIEDLGVYCNEVHLFPFRTEKLSPFALMVLPFWGWESKSTPLFKSRSQKERLFLYVRFLVSLPKLPFGRSGSRASKYLPKTRTKNLKETPLFKSRSPKGAAFLYVSFFEKVSRNFPFGRSGSRASKYLLYAST